MLYLTCQKERAAFKPYPHCGGFSQTAQTGIRCHPLSEARVPPNHLSCDAVLAEDALMNGHLVLTGIYLPTWQHLSGAAETDLPSSLPEYPDCHNEDLGELVLNMVRSGQMEKAIMEECGRSDCHSAFTNLVATFESLQLNPSQTHDAMYNIDTCVEFHWLLLATLLTYGKGLCVLSKPVHGDV